MKDIKHKNESLGRKKREAPRPPVLVDIDVGFSEQNVTEEAKSEDRGSREKRQEPPARPPPPELASPVLSAQMGKSQQSGVLSREQGSNAKDKINGYNHKFSSKLKTSANTEQEIHQQSSFTQQNGFMSTNHNKGDKCATGQNPLHQDGKVTEGGFHPILNNSNSSGIGSSIYSDSSATDPDQFKTKLVITARPNGLSPMIFPAAADRGATDYASSADDLDDSDSDYSDEMTMDFDEEEEQVEKRRMKLYEEYQGEDFAKYLEDEEDMPAKSRKKKRKMKKRSKKEMNDGVEKTVVPTISPTGTYSTSSGENPGKRSLKLKLGQMFSFPGAEGKQKSGQLTPSGIHAFSYADSKIGTISEKDFGKSMFTSRRKSSGSGSAMFHETSDAQDFERTSSQRWWRKDMLSAKTLDSNSDIMLKAKRQDIDLSSSLSADSINPAIHNGYAGHGGGYKTDDDEKMNDFESYRKNTFLYNSKARKHSGSNKPNTSLFRKISRSFKKGQYKDVSDNTVDNPLSMAADKDGFYL